MATAISPWNRWFRGFFIICLLVLLLALIVAVGCVLVMTEQVFLVIPLTLMGVFLFGSVRWAMYWLSTPEEQAVFARGLNYEPVLAVIRDLARELIRAWRPGSRPGD